MSLVNYLRQKSGSWLAIKSILFVIIWASVYTALFLMHNKIVAPGTPALSNVRLTVTNLHNQLYFLAPLLIVSSLLFFSRPQSVEFFYLVLRKRLRQYLLIYTVFEMFLLTISLLISSLISAFVTKAPIAPQAGSEIIILLAHFLGVFVLILSLNALVFLTDKLKAGAAVEVLLLLDTLCIAKLSWSFFLAHGLVNLIDNIFFVFDPLIYLIYGFLLYYCLGSRAFYQLVQYV